MSRRTKIIIAVVLVLCLIVAAVLVYFFFWRQPPPTPDPGEFPEPGEEIVPEEEPPTEIPDIPPGAWKPILRQLSKVPIAGSVLGNRSGEPIARYVERATGNVYEIEADGEGEKRLTNTTIPKVYEAIWSKSGTALVARYAREGSETIESFSGKVSSGTGTEGELQGTFLQRNILDLAAS